MQASDKDSPHRGSKSITRSLLHGMGFLLVVDIVALALGFAFFLIAHGTLMGLLRLAPYWRPAAKVFRLAFDQPNSSDAIAQLPVRGYHAFRLIRTVAVMAILVGLGVWLLVQNGFCAQNIICIATRTH